MKLFLRRNAQAFFSLILILGGYVSLSGQGLTTSGISGVVTDTQGNPVSGVNVTAVHVPTGTTVRATTNANGRFTMRGLKIGGPYTVSTSSDLYHRSVKNDVYLELSRASEVNFEVQEKTEEIEELEEFEVVATNDPIFDSSKTGVGIALNREALETRPQINRSFLDFARYDPNVVLFPGAGAGRLSVAGQNNRYNSIQVDGVKMNDQFGLGNDGLPSLTNPISVDALEEIKVEVSPYDVRQSGFTGGSINAVTKSGSNQFHGSFYYIFTDNTLRGENVVTGTKPEFHEKTYGFTASGPILKNKLFFFLNYEEFERREEPASPGFFPFPEDVEFIRKTVMERYGFDPGTFGELDPIVTNDDKFVVKVDWNITEKHRFTLRYNKTDGVDFSPADFDDFSTSSPETALTSAFFNTFFLNDTWVGELSSRWAPNLRTEFRFGTSRFKADAENPNTFPEMRIDDIRGITRTGEPTSKGELFWGTDDSRQSNDLSTDVKNASFVVEWSPGGNHNITGGFDWEETKFFNLFLQQTFGEIEFDGFDRDADGNPIGGFVDDEFDVFDRDTGVQGLPIAARSDFTVAGFFIQDHWDVSNRLTLTFGVRYDAWSTDSLPTENPGLNGKSFRDLFGVANTNTLASADLLAPRFSFNYALDNDRTTQIRGGFGLFAGRNPGVWISNAFSNNGVSTRQFRFGGFGGGPFPDEFPKTVSEYINGTNANPAFFFDKNNPVVFLDPNDPSATVSSSQRVDLLADGIEMPSIYKFNIAVDRKLPWFGGMQASVEFLQTWNNEGLFTTDLNLKEIDPAPDGRRRFDGNDLVDGYGTVLQLTNTGSEGTSSNVVISLNRPMKNNWFFNFSYRWQNAEDAGRQGSSTALSNFADTPHFNVNQVEVGTSRDEIKNRIIATLGKNFEIFKGFKTDVTLHYEGRSGRPFSYLFDEDVNGDDASFDNDLIYVPTGPSDPIVTFTSDSDQDLFFQFLDDSGLSEFGGGPAPRNGFRSQWVHRFDLHLAQEIPLWRSAKGIIFVDIENLMNLINSSAGRVDDVRFQTIALGVSRNPIVEVDGVEKIEYDFDRIPRRSDNIAGSRYRINIGFRFEF